MDSFSLRKARADELQRLLGIDDEASELFTRAGLTFTTDANHPFSVAESARWAKAIEEQLAHVAVNHQDEPIGFVTLSFVDQEPYLDQISVLPGVMQRGIGTMLLRHAISWSNGRPLWLTTYSHLSWNKPFYERRGFTAVAEGTCGPELRAILQEQRAVLPDPHHRVAMVHCPLAYGAQVPYPGRVHSQVLDSWDG